MPLLAVVIDCFLLVVPAFVVALGHSQQAIEHSIGLITTYASRCEHYAPDWKKRNIPYAHGLLLILLTHMHPYSNEIKTASQWRNQLNRISWTIEKYPEFCGRIIQNEVNAKMDKFEQLARRYIEDGMPVTDAIQRASTEVKVQFDQEMHLHEP